MAERTIQENLSYNELLQHVQGLFSDENHPLANMSNLASLLYWSVPQINWVGFYLRQHEELILGPFHGKPACVRIAIGRGVCGTAAAKRETIIVDDVTKFDGHITCDAVSQSEIVVPMMIGGNVLGVLDVDSPVLSRFTNKERVFFQQCVGYLLDASVGWEQFGRW